MLWLFVLVTIPCGTGGRASPGIAHCELPKKQRDLNSFLWRVHRDPPAFLFGTIHVSYDLVWPFIPKNAKRALEQSHDVYFELELGEPATLGAIASCQKLPQGQRLREVLPASLYTRLETHLDYVHFMLPTWLGLANRDTARRHAEYLFKTFVGDWERKRPVWLLVLLNWLTEADVQNHRAPLLDVGLAHMAAAGGKRTGAVERPEEQCLPLNMLSPSKVLFALNHTLQMQEMIRMGSSKATNSTKELINHYNCGDLSSIIFQQEPSQVLGWIDGSLSPDDAFVAHSIDHYLRQELIYKRNARMAQRVYSLLLRHPDKSFFFAFGVGHFLGNRSVINVLRDSGLHVEHVPSDRKIDSYRKIHQGHSFPQMARIRAEDLEDDVPWSGFDVKSTSESEEEKESLKNESPKLWERRRGGMNDRRFKDLWVRKVESKTLLPPARAKNVNMHVTMETTPGLLCVHKQSQTTSASPSAASNNLGLSLILSWVLINFG